LGGGIIQLDIQIHNKMTMR